ncbi:hypothetical protein GCM10023186_22500 [Hymenobacter koreensis]|uniref:Uncharacterized protein n=1 Tax=Hymenobacter koreensis TaxID=1084523 RepID=A0ABP8IZT2_9BACT
MIKRSDHALAVEAVQCLEHHYVEPALVGVGEKLLELGALGRGCSMPFETNANRRTIKVPDEK